ncbi:RHS repeat-associated core domain-containing protein [Bacteroides bouchesdurhonensis]|uniref:RHS repeat-associated core domain-containing protein n=3 Tax=Bacteroides bouchesdurhonensis TaxID=1841855 RepID=UPI0021CB0971|nr:RHS repeat-associated core domain-containing protein [Bacteroides bouchesdurhonensis]
MPDEVTFANGNSIRHEYAADGTKLRTVHKTGATTLTTDYCGNAVYENGVLRMLLNEAGYVSFPDRKFHFYLKDHQGNTRVVADKDGNVEETNNYYPFGGTFTSTASVQPYKYNGKELDAKNGLNWYDYGARQYDAAIGRWHVVDRRSEKYLSLSPYQYGANNPVNNVDINGDSIWYTLKDDIVTMHVTAKIFNNSSDNINMQRAAEDIISDIKNTYEGSFKWDDGKKYDLKIDMNLDVAKTMEDVVDSDHLFVLADAQGEGGRGVTSMSGGKVMTLAASDFANDNWFSNIFSDNNTFTATHEFGHALGLEHSLNPLNIMRQKGTSHNSSATQRVTMLKKQNNINRGSNSYQYIMRKIPYPFVHNKNITITTNDLGLKWR